MMLYYYHIMLYYIILYYIILQGAWGPGGQGSRGPGGQGSRGPGGQGARGPRGQGARGPGRQENQGEGERGRLRSLSTLAVSTREACSEVSAMPPSESLRARSGHQSCKFVIRSFCYFFRLFGFFSFSCRLFCCSFPLIAFVFRPQSCAGKGRGTAGRRLSL